MSLLRPSNIQKTTFNIFLAIIFLKIAGFVRDFLMANYYGIDRNVDIYFYALLIPTIIFTIVSASHNSFFIPYYLQIKNTEGREKAKSYASHFTYSLGGILLIVLFFIGWVISPWMIEANKLLFIHPDDINLFYTAVKLSSMFVFFYLLSTFLISLLQAEHSYIASYLAQLTIPFITIIFIIFGYKQYHILAVLYGMVLGAFISFIILLFLAQKKSLIYTLSRNQLSIHWLKDAKSFYILILVSIFPGIIIFIDQYMASRLGVGQLAVLNYGYKIPDMLSEVFGMGLGIALFSHFSQWVIEKKSNDIILAVQRTIKLSTIFILPICLYLHLYSHSIIQILFERGAFGNNETTAVAEITSHYIFVIYLFTIIVIAARLVSAIHKNHILLIMGIINLTVKIFLNILFINLFGLKGIPMATIIMYIIAIIFLYQFLIKQHYFKVDANFIRQLTFSFVLVIFIGSVWHLLQTNLAGNNPYFNLTMGLINLAILFGLSFLLNQKFKWITY